MWHSPRLLAIVPLLSVGCGYQSSYSPPADGRVRPVWRENNVIVERSGRQPSDECLRTALALTDTEVLRQPREYGVVRTDEFWVPRYYGPPIVIFAPGIAPILPRPPLFVPFLAPVALRSAGASVGAVGPLSGLRLGGGGDSGKALAALAIVALVVLPAVDLGLAIAPAESPGASSQAIDQVNALNDLSRSTGSPCSYEATAGGAP